MSDPQKPTRFARAWPDGTMSVESGGLDYIEARKRLVESHDDDDVELLEIIVTVVRNHGRPKLAAVREHCVMCPTCGETVCIEAPQ